MSDRFELEQNILNCWNVTSDIQLLLDKIDTMSEDQIQNYLIGLVTMYELKFDKTFSTFETLIKERKI